MSNLSDHWGKAITAAAAAALAAAGSLSVAIVSNEQHKRQVEAGFRAEVMKNHSPHDITIVTDGAVRQGFLNKGAAINTGTSRVSTLIVAASPEAVCWYTTLRVTGGNKKLPLISQIFGGKVNETLYANQAFQDDYHECIPVPDGGTMDSFSGNSVSVPASPASPTALQATP